MDEVRKLARSIDKIALLCPHGLAIIVGEYPPPSDQILLDVATWPSSNGPHTSGGRVGDPTAAQASALLELKGPIESVGWSALQAAGRECKKLFPRDFEAYRLHVTYVAGDQWRSGDESTLERIARECGLDARTVRRRRHEVPRRIARAAIMGAQSANMQ